MTTFSLVFNIMKLIASRSRLPVLKSRLPYQRRSRERAALECSCGASHCAMGGAVKRTRREALHGFARQRKRQLEISRKHVWTQHPAQSRESLSLPSMKLDSAFSKDGASRKIRRWAWY